MNLKAKVARLALSPHEAAASLGVSRDFFDQHIGPELRIVRRGRRRIVPLVELERWLGENAEHIRPPHSQKSGCV